MIAVAPFVATNPAAIAFAWWPLMNSVSKTCVQRSEGSAWIAASTSSWIWRRAAGSRTSASGAPLLAAEKMPAAKTPFQKARLDTAVELRPKPTFMVCMLLICLCRRRGVSSTTGGVSKCHVCSWFGRPALAAAASALALAICQAMLGFRSNSRSGGGGGCWTMPSGAPALSATLTFLPRAQFAHCSRTSSNTSKASLVSAMRESAFACSQRSCAPPSWWSSGCLTCSTSQMKSSASAKRSTGPRTWFRKYVSMKWSNTSASSDKSRGGGAPAASHQNKLRDCNVAGRCGSSWKMRGCESYPSLCPYSS
mmetsp:Transcript_42121/g.119155  ORF Transcript_42121/g.119155 Transcript_42121/m.119155 type:complete len:309 (-) Transcript_42121:203-1129(-)